MNTLSVYTYTALLKLCFSEPILPLFINVHVYGLDPANRKVHKLRHE